MRVSEKRAASSSWLCPVNLKESTGFSIFELPNAILTGFTLNEVSSKPLS